MEKVKTFLADISDLLNEKNYQKIYEKVPAFRQEKADRLKHREDQAQASFSALPDGLQYL